MAAVDTTWVQEHNARSAAARRGPCVNRSRERPVECSRRVGESSHAVFVLHHACVPNGRVAGRNDAGDAAPAILRKAGCGSFPPGGDGLWVATAGKEGKQPDRASVAFPYAGHNTIRVNGEPRKPRDPKRHPSRLGTRAS